MKKLYAGLLAVLVLVGCTPTGPGAQPTPTPIVVPESTPGPVASATPSQEELSAEAERVYRTFFNEWIRLEREGGAEEPTQILKDNGAALYLAGVRALLRDSYEREVRYEGPDPVVTVKANPGSGSPDTDSDPRLTLTVCEDSSGGWTVGPGSSQPGVVAEGQIYLAYVGDRMKVVDANLQQVDACAH